MQKATKILFLIVLAIFVFDGVAAFATPSTTYWSPATMDIQPYNVWHLGVDNYFIVKRPSSLGPKDGPSSFPTDVQVTVGVLPWEKIQMEVGIDAMYPSNYPYLFHAKIGTPENSLFAGSPGINIGIFNVGTKTGGAANAGRTDYDTVDFIIGKTLPYNLGRLHAAYYVGNRAALRSSSDDEQNMGFMIAYDKGFLSTTDKSGNEYKRVVLAADYISGKNYMGGGGFGLYYYFTKDISLLVGPIWMNDTMLNGPMKITTQLDINI